MAFNTKQFILQARQKGVPDEETYKYLQNKGLLEQKATQPVQPMPTQQTTKTLEPTSRPNIASSILGVAGRVLQVPQTVATIGARTIGGIAGGLYEKSPQTAMGYIKQAGSELSQIPKEVAKGATEGFWKSSNLTMPSKELGLKGVGGLAVDILGDPLNILGASYLSKAKEAKIAAGKIPLAEKAARKTFQKAIPQTTKTIAKQGEIAPLIKYKGMAGTPANMIKKIEKELPKLKNALDDVVNKSNKTIDITPLMKDLRKTANDFLKGGTEEGSKLADMFIKKINELSSKANNGMLSMKDAVELKRSYDAVRQTATGELSNAKPVLVKISNWLRNEVNKTPEVGKLDKQISTFLKAVGTRQPGYLKIAATKIATEPLVKVNLIPAKIGAKGVLGLTSPLQSQAISTPLKTTLSKLLYNLSKSKAGQEVRNAKNAYSIATLRKLLTSE